MDSPWHGYYLVPIITLSPSARHGSPHQFSLFHIFGPTIYLLRIGNVSIRYHFYRSRERPGNLSIKQHSGATWETWQPQDQAMLFVTTWEIWQPLTVLYFILFLSSSIFSGHLRDLAMSVSSTWCIILSGHMRDSATSVSSIILSGHTTGLANSVSSIILSLPHERPDNVSIKYLMYHS